MKFRIASAFALIVFMALISFTAFGQVTSSLSGTVTDPNGAVVIGATVTVRNAASGSEFKTVTSNQGTYNVPSLGAGTYIVVVTASGFKSATVQNVEIDAGTPATANVTLDVGQATETVVVQGGAQIIQTQTASVSTTLNTNQIINLPLVSRNPVNFVSMMAGVNTPRDVRNSTINGLPESAIDITLDGINVQDNFNKTTDGLFVRVAPTLDSIEEVTVSTSTPEAVGGAMGAVQVKFVTRSGGNDFHGSLYNYHRNTALNSAYWFTNRDTTPYNVKAAKPCGDPSSPAFNSNTMVPYDPDNCHAPRAANLFHQFGGRVGGPIRIPGLFNGRNRAFFFVNYEEFRQPTAVVRQRTILHPLAQQGVFRYGSSGQVNLLELAARSDCDPGASTVPCTSTIDPVVGKLLADIRNATGGAGGITQLTDPNQQRFTYNPSGSGLNKRPTVRFDVNVTDKHKVELSWTYQMGRGKPDFLNNVEPAFPGFPNQGDQPADRYTGSLAVRSTLTSTLVNEARAGLSGGPSRFNPSASTADFVGSVANQAGFNLGGAPGANATGIAILGINGPTTVNAPSRRNPLFREFGDTLTWSRGAHSLVFGGKIIDTQLTFNQQTLVPTINFGLDTTDPANAMFNGANFPGASATELNNARNLYAVLTGRITAINANARLVEETGQFTYLGNAFERSHQKEFGLFAQDSWRVNQNLTVNYGLRWEVARPFTVDNSSYTTATFDDIWGVSGLGNLFKPGTLAGRPTQFIQMKEGTGAYNTDYTNFAPSLGLAWRVNANDGWLKRIVGEGQTVVRGGYSLAYNREGIGTFRGAISANPGAVITTNRSITLGNLGTLPVLFRERDRLGAPAFPTTPTYPLTGEPFVQATNSVNIYDPNIKIPYSQSWTFGIQRELDKDTVIELRYVGARNLGAWETYNLNNIENNIAENGLLNEFKLAQANLRANIAAGRGSTFAYTGAPGTSPLPITLAYFSGLSGAAVNNTASYTSSNFTSATFVNTLALNNPNLCCASTSANTAFGTSPSYAFSLDNNATFRANALRAGLPANFMLTNPGLRGGANFIGNGGGTRYDALQIDLRRRLSNGLQVQANYQFAKAFESQRATNPGSPINPAQANPAHFSFRTPRLNRLDTNTLRHAFKVSWVYELPIGRGKPLLGGAGAWLDRLVGGWEFHGAGRVQSGQLFDFGNVNLVGMTNDELRDMFKIRHGVVVDLDGNPVLTNGRQTPATYLLPQDVLANTIRAFNVSATSATGYGQGGPPTGRYIAPAGNASCIQVYSGQCAPQNVFVTGPKFTRFDLSLKKQVRLTERFNFELRGEFLNAFNNINFFNPNAAAFITPSTQTFMQVTTAYTDSANTNDPGGRLVQIVARFNF